MPPKKQSKDVTIRGGIRYTADNPPPQSKTPTPRPKTRNQKPAASMPPEEPTQ